MPEGDDTGGKGAREDEQREEAAQERRHLESITIERWAAGGAALISALTLLVLICTLRVYNRQATIMANQADISKAQADIARNQLAEMRLNDRPIIEESEPAAIVPYTTKVCSGKVFPGPPSECHTEEGRTIKVCFKNSGKAVARVLINGGNLANQPPAVPGSEFDVAKFYDCATWYFFAEQIGFRHSGLSHGGMGPFILPSQKGEQCGSVFPGILDPKQTLANFEAGRGTYFMGCVDYEDALHNHYQLQVCRYLDVPSNTVKTCPGYDYESDYRPEDNPFPNIGKPSATPTK